LARSPPEATVFQLELKTADCELNMDNAVMLGWAKTTE